MRQFLVSAAFVAATMIAAAPACAADGPAPKPQEKSPVLMRPGYQMLSVVEISIRTNGVHLYGRNQPVVNVDCSGFGRLGPKRTNRLGYPENTYHLFTCAITTPSVRVVHAKVLWWSNNTYRYDFFGCKNGRACA